MRAMATKREKNIDERKKKKLISIVRIDCSKVWNCRINAIFELRCLLAPDWERETLTVQCAPAVWYVRATKRKIINKSLSLSLARCLKEQKKPMAILISCIIWPRKRANELKSMSAFNNMNCACTSHIGGALAYVFAALYIAYKWLYLLYFTPIKTSSTRVSEGKSQNLQKRTRKKTHIIEQRIDDSILWFPFL